MSIMGCLQCQVQSVYVLEDLEKVKMVKPTEKLNLNDPISKKRAKRNQDKCTPSTAPDTPEKMNISNVETVVIEDIEQTIKQVPDPKVKSNAVKTNDDDDDDIAIVEEEKVLPIHLQGFFKFNDTKVIQQKLNQSHVTKTLFQFVKKQSMPDVNLSDHHKDQDLNDSLSLLHKKDKLVTEYECATLANNCLCQIVTISNDACLLLGGASSPQIERTFNSVTQVSHNGVAEAKAGMLIPRVYFGCCLSKHDQRVIVIGGQISASETTPNCEIFDINKNAWTQLAPLNKAMISCTPIVVEQKYRYRLNRTQMDSHRSVLYAFGGVVKHDNQMEFSFDIQRLVLGDLTRVNSVPLKNQIWVTLNVQLPTQICHFGAIQRINAMDFTQIVIFGGWSPTGTLKAYLLKEEVSANRQLISHSLCEIRSVKNTEALEFQDNFITNGATIRIKQSQGGLKSSNDIELIQGQHNLLLFNHQTLQFKGLQTKTLSISTPRSHQVNPEQTYAIEKIEELD